MTRTQEGCEKDWEQSAMDVHKCLLTCHTGTTQSCLLCSGLSAGHVLWGRDAIQGISGEDWEQERAELNIAELEILTTIPKETTNRITF